MPVGLPGSESMVELELLESGLVFSSGMTFRSRLVKLPFLMMSRMLGCDELAIVVG
jgi:hypothetical protein